MTLLKEATSASDSETKLAWKKKANCLGIDPDLFYPERGVSSANAKKVCHGCIVQSQCLEYALCNGEKFGIWGGLSERERRILRRERRLNQQHQQADNVIALHS